MTDRDAISSQESDRDVVTRKAANKASYPAMTWVDTTGDFMKQVGNEAIKQQQRKMRDTADQENTKYQGKKKIPTYHKGGKVRRTGLAILKKGERVLTKRQQKKDWKDRGKRSRSK